MRTSPLLSSLTLGLLLFVPPVYAVNYTGEAVLDWSTLRFSGIPITVTRYDQATGVTIATNLNFFQQIDSFPDWRSHTTSLTVPQAATGSSIADSHQLNAAFSLFGSVINGGAETERFGTFTALATGQLTVSIDYTLQRIAGRETDEQGSIQLGGGMESIPGGSVYDFALLRHTEYRDAQSGTLSITDSFQRGDIGTFGAAVLAGTSFYTVPLPDMLWPTLAGMVGIAFWAERRRRQTSLTR